MVATALASHSAHSMLPVLLAAQQGRGPMPTLNSAEFKYNDHGCGRRQRMPCCWSWSAPARLPHNAATSSAQTPGHTALSQHLVIPATYKGAIRLPQRPLHRSRRQREAIRRFSARAEPTRQKNDWDAPIMYVIKRDGRQVRRREAGGHSTRGTGAAAHREASQRA